MEVLAPGRIYNVIARQEINGFYYEGRVNSDIPTKVNGRDVYHVDFKYLPEQVVQREHVIILKGARPWPNLQPYNYVLVKIKPRRKPRIPHYVPGLVFALPLQNRPRLYTVVLYNKQQICTKRSKIVLIGPDRYNVIIRLLIRVEPEEPKNQKKPVPPKNKPPTTDTGTDPDPDTGTDTGTGTGSQVPPINPTSNNSTQTSAIVTADKSSTAKTKKAQKEVQVLIPINAVVLARWLDDGWFYYGRIVTQPDDDDDDNCYTVIDASQHRELIKHEDIFRDTEKPFDAIQPGDHVIGLHPKYIYSYAPGIATEAYDLGVDVTFYDNAVTKLPWSKVYKISCHKYNEYVKYINDRLCTIRGDVIARDDESGFYKQYVAISSDVNQHTVKLKISDNRYMSQQAIHVFPIIRPTRHNQQSWQYVLAPTDSTCDTYLPAKVTSQEPFQYTLCNDQERENVDRNKCFYLNDQYYKNAINYWKKKFQHIPTAAQY